MKAQLYVIPIVDEETGTSFTVGEIYFPTFGYAMNLMLGIISADESRYEGVTLVEEADFPEETNNLLQTIADSQQAIGKLNDIIGETFKNHFDEEPDNGNTITVPDNQGIILTDG